MKRAMLVLMLMLIPIALAFSQYGYEPGVILLKLRNPDVVTLLGNRVVKGSSKFQSTIDKYNAIDSYKLPYAGPHTYGWYHVDFPKDAPVKEIRKALSTCSDLSDVTLNFYGTFSEAPNDTYWNDQWAVQKIQIAETWDYIKPDNEILVGIIDSGLDRYHDDLSENVWTNPDEIPDNYQDDDNNGYVDDMWGWDFADDNNNPMEDPFDPEHDYHGTRVAGIIAARTYNALGVAGIAGGWQGQTGLRLIGLRIFKVDEFGQSVWDQEDAGKAIEYLTELRKQGNTVIANMSFQLPDSSDNDYGYFKDAVKDSKDDGVIMIAAAGNQKDKSDYENSDENPNLPAPARWDGVLAIGASTDGATLDDEEKVYYSLYDTDYNKLLAVAPVVGSSMNVYTTYKNDGYIDWFEGTSAACPLAVGVVALLLSGDPNLTYTDIADIFKHTSEKINSDEYNYQDDGNGLLRCNEVGYGRINAYDALLYAFPPVSVEITGPNSLNSGETGSFTANPSNGFQPYINYRWWKRNDEGEVPMGGVNPMAPPPGEWNELDGWEGSQTIQQTSTYDFSLKCRVYDSQVNTAEDIHSVIVGSPFKKPSVSKVEKLPHHFTVYPNYPNPFNPVTSIDYELAEDSYVLLVIYDIQGKELERLVDGEQIAGYKKITWNASEYGSGIYFYHFHIIRNGEIILNKLGKMLVVK